MRFRLGTAVFTPPLLLTDGNAGLLGVLVLGVAFVLQDPVDTPQL